VLAASLCSIAQFLFTIEVDHHRHHPPPTATNHHRYQPFELQLATPVQPVQNEKNAPRCHPEHTVEQTTPQPAPKSAETFQSTCRRKE
jgi:hypothetical protein